MSIESMKQWAEDVSKAYDMTAWGHTQRAAEILKQTRNSICTAIEQAEKQEPVATKLETQQFNCFHVSAEDFQRLKALPVGTKLYTTPPAAQRERVVFPTMLRKMWSGGEVQAWLDENVNGIKGEV